MEQKISLDEMSRTAITGGRLVDGSGAEGVDADLIVRGRTIEAIVPPGTHYADDVRRIAADGLVVCPGFIDLHTHSDVSILFDGRAQSKIHQGVTTDVVGNCGFSAFPVNPAFRLEQQGHIAGIGDDPIEFSWEDLDGYSSAIMAAGTAINIAPMVGHGQLRIAALGREQERLTADGLDRICSALEKALDQGAFGMSTGLTYVPSAFARAEELSQLAKILERHGALYATHARGSNIQAIDEVVNLSRTTRVRTQFSHAAINDPAAWGSADSIVDQFEQARAAGLDIAFDVYPYDASASSLTQYLPSWLTADRLGEVRKPTYTSARTRAIEQIGAGWGTPLVPWLWERVTLSRTDSILGLSPGITMTQAAGHLGMSEPELMLELCAQGGNRVQVVLHYRTEGDMRTFLRYPNSVVGSDGSALPFQLGARLPHPRSFGTYPRVLGRYVRELADLTLEDAIRKMTSAPAARCGIKDRGMISPGLAADIVVFDPLRVNDLASFAEPGRMPVGVHHVLVNGSSVLEDGVQTSNRPGQVLHAS